MIAVICRISYQGSPGWIARRIGPKNAVSCNFGEPKKLMPANSRGAESMELAKITGITPPELTLSGDVYKRQVLYNVPFVLLLYFR